MCTDDRPTAHLHQPDPRVLHDFEPRVVFDLEPVDSVTVTTLMDAAWRSTRQASRPSSAATATSTTPPDSTA